MPSGWIDPEQFLRHQGIGVYYVYRHDDYDEGVREYCYTTDMYGGDCDDPCSFDVRELSSYAREKTHEQIIREAIDAGELPLAESLYKESPEDEASCATDPRSVSRDQMERLLTILRDNGIALDEAETVAEAICYVLDLLFEEADLDGEIIP